VAKARRCSGNWPQRHGGAEGAGQPPRHQDTKKIHAIQILGGFVSWWLKIPRSAFQSSVSRRQTLQHWLRDLSQFQQPGNLFPHGQGDAGFKLSGTAFQSVIFHGGQTLNVRHALIGAGQPAHAGQLHFVITAANLSGQRHTYAQGAPRILVFARDNEERAEPALETEIHPIDFTRPWICHKSFRARRRAVPRPRRAIPSFRARLFLARA